MSADVDTTPDVEPTDGVEIDTATDEEGAAVAEVEAPKDSDDDSSAVRQRLVAIPVIPVVLVFINQATTSKERPDPAMASSSANVSLAKVHGEWLISKFDPL